MNLLISESLSKFNVVDIRYIIYFLIIYAVKQIQKTTNNSVSPLDFNLFAVDDFTDISFYAINFDNNRVPIIISKASLFTIATIILFVEMLWSKTSKISTSQIQNLLLHIITINRDDLGEFDMYFANYFVENCKLLYDVNNPIHVPDCNFVNNILHDSLPDTYSIIRNLFFDI